MRTRQDVRTDACKPTYACPCTHALTLKLTSIRAPAHALTPAHRHTHVHTKGHTDTHRHACTHTGCRWLGRSWWRLLQRQSRRRKRRHGTGLISLLPVLKQRTQSGRWSWRLSGIRRPPAVLPRHAHAHAHARASKRHTRVRQHRQPGLEHVTLPPAASQTLQALVCCLSHEQALTPVLGPDLNRAFVKSEQGAACAVSCEGSSGRLHEPDSPTVTGWM
jgi:hypothetical protein